MFLTMLCIGVLIRCGVELPNNGISPIKINLMDFVLCLVGADMRKASNL